MKKICPPAVFLEACTRMGIDGGQTMKEETKITTAPAITIPETDKTEVKQARSPYRIKSKAGNTDKLPSYLPVITNQSYLNALTLNKNSTTHLHMLPSTSKLEYENNILYLDGKSINYTFEFPHF